MKTFKNVSYCAVFSLLIVGFTIMSMDRPNVVGTLQLGCFKENPDYDFELSRKSDRPLDTLYCSVILKDNRSPQGNVVIYDNLPVYQLFGSKDGCLVEYKNCNQPLFSGFFRCIPNPYTKERGQGNTFEDQFNYGIKSFIKEPSSECIKRLASVGQLSNKSCLYYPLVEKGILLPNGFQGPNGCPTEAHFRRKMISESSLESSNVRLDELNITQSIFNRQIASNRRDKFLLSSTVVLKNNTDIGKPA